MAGVLEGVSYMGRDLSLFVRLAGRKTPLVLRLGSARGRALNLAQGKAVCCGWPPSASRVLTR